MISQQNLSTISDLRFKTKKVLKKASKNPVYVLNRSTPQAVLMSVEEYQSLIEALEDYYDTLDALELEKEDKKQVRWTTHEEVKKLLNV